ncbi:MAG: endonuclease/exonuclease/phosphatase family protein [Phycisphaerales bacterium]
MPPFVSQKLALLLVLCFTTVSEAQLRVATWNCAALRGDLSAIRDILAEIAEDDTTGWSTPPAVLILQEVNEGDQVTLRNLLNSEVPGPTWRIATYTNSDSGGAQACIYRGELLTESVSDHRDIFTGAGRFSDRWRFTIDATNGSTGFWVYSCHLKASQGSSNEDLRESGTQAILNNIATLPSNANIFWGGDFNFYSNSEPGYDLIASTVGSNAIVDPLGNGSWSGSGNAIKHTQSPRSTSSSGGLVGGGMDDRFDFVFSSQSAQEANGITLIPGSYRALGNDGQHYDAAINSGNNFYFPGQISRSNQLADALHDGADHVPVIVEFALPAIGSVSAEFDRVVLGPNPQAPFRVSHTTPVVVAAGSSSLEWTIAGSGGINGERSGTTAVQGSSLTSLPVESSAVGPQSGTIFLDSPVEGTGGLGGYPLNWTCVRPAQASLSGETYVPGGVVSASFEVSPEPVVVEIDVWNFGFDALQSRLFVDGLLAPPASPILDVLEVPNNLGTGPAQIRLLVDASQAGNFTSGLVFQTRDEDIPGQTEGILGLSLELSIGSTVQGDFNGDGLVNFNDLLIMLSGWGPCSGCPEDLDGNNDVGFSDILILLTLL